MRKLLIATRSKGKFPEIVSLLGNVPFELLSLNEAETIPLDFEVNEIGSTFESNALLKAMTLGNMSGLLTLAEDSGLCVDALGGRPGVLSARYTSGTDENRYIKLLDEMKDIPKEKRSARFMIVVALYDPTTQKVWLCQGSQEGSITFEPKGVQGFGYDPVFFIAELGKTAAEVSQEEKNRVSHRGQALQKIKEILTNNHF